MCLVAAVGLDVNLSTYGNCGRLVPTNPELAYVPLVLLTLTERI